jgi:hypothetical protein
MIGGLGRGASTLLAVSGPYPILSSRIETKRVESHQCACVLDKVITSQKRFTTQ